MMTYGAVKRRVLELMSQYSVGGETISPAYNNQGDYEHRIPGLLNAALIYVRNKYPRRNAMQLSGGTKQGRWILHHLPSDFKSLCTGGVKAGEERWPTNEYRLFGESGILVPDDGQPHYIEYWRKPEQVIVGTAQSGDPDESYEIDEDADALEVAIAYAASWLTLYDDSFDHTALQHLYEDLLEAMRPPLTAEFRDVGYDVPPFDWGCGL